MPTITPHPIWKLEADDPELAGQGEFCLRYMLAVISNRPLYLGQCECRMARHLQTPIIAFRDTVNCVFCGEPVSLSPVPRVHDGRWVLDAPNDADDPGWDLSPTDEELDDEVPF